MTAREKRTLLIVGAVVLFWLGSLTVVTLAVVNAGMLTVQVHENHPGGSDISLRIPAAFVVLALKVIPEDVIAGEIARADRWTPIARSFTRSLASGPDCVLVSVDSPRETVRIAKKGRHLLVDVKDAGERVHIAVPFAIVSTMLERIDRASRG